MSNGVEEVSIEQKEACAVLCMRMMLEDYSQRTGISFEKAFEEFASTDVYNQLFDFETHLWAESPDYLALLFTQGKE